MDELYFKISKLHEQVNEFWLEYAKDESDFDFKTKWENITTTVTEADDILNRV